MPVHVSVTALYVECRVQMNVHVPVWVNAFETGGLFGAENAVSVSSWVGPPPAPGARSLTSCALPAAAPKRHVTVSPTLRLTADGVQTVPLASTSTVFAGAGSDAANVTVTGPA